MPDDESKAPSNTAEQRPILVEPSTKCLYTLNPETGQPVWIVDYETGSPMAARQLFADPSSGCLCAASVAGGSYVWVVDPFTGKPMPASQAQMDQAPEQQGAQAEADLQTQTNETAQPAAQPITAATDQEEQPPALQGEQAEAVPQAQASETAQPAAQPTTAATDQEEQPPALQGELAEAAQVSPLEQVDQNPASQVTADAEDQPSALAQLESALQGGIDQQQDDTADHALDIPEPAAADDAQNLPAPEDPSAPPSSDAPTPSEPTAAQPAPPSSDAPAPSEPTAAPSAPGMSGAAIAGLAFGILAIAASFIPAVRVGSIFLAPIGAILAIVGIAGASKGKKRGIGLAIGGIVLSIAAVAVAIALQGSLSSLFNATSTQPQPASQTASSSASSAASAEQSKASSPATAESDNLAIGESFALENGLSVRVESVQRDMKNFDGSKMTSIVVVYTNNGSSSAPFNMYDWKAQDENRTLHNASYYPNAENGLSSGEVPPGETVTGNIYFDGDVEKALYYVNFFRSQSNAGWSLR